MKRWALVTSFLYLLVLFALSWPVAVIAFSDEDKSPRFDRFLKFAFTDPDSYIYWCLIGTMALVQFVLLIVPVRLTAGRPVPRALLIIPVLLTGLAFGTLVFAGGWSLAELIKGGMVNDFGTTICVILALASWGFWSVVFLRLSWTDPGPGSFDRMIRWLVRGSILELLVAVPSHVIVRGRNYCCAGFNTVVGLMTGISIMLLAFGPAVFFLFASRINSKMPAHPPIRRLFVPRVSLDYLIASVAMISALFGLYDRMALKSRGDLRAYLMLTAIASFYLGALWLESQEFGPGWKRLVTALTIGSLVAIVFAVADVAVFVIPPLAAWIILRRRFNDLYSLPVAAE